MYKLRKMRKRENNGNNNNKKEKNSSIRITCIERAHELIHLERDRERAKERWRDIDIVKPFIIGSS